MFQIPEAASPVSVRGKKPEAMPPQAEDVTPKTPPGCEGWTSEMEEFAQSLLKDTDIEQFKYEIGSFYPETEDMPGLTRYLQKLQQDMITEPAQVQSKQKPKQPAGWTTEMTDFVEGSLGGGNDVKTTINLFKMEVVEAFNIQGLEEHVEKLKNKLVRKNNPLAHQHQVSSAPMGWHDNMTALVQKYLREGNRDVDSMVQGLEIEEPDALHLTGIHEYVTTLVLKFQTQGGR